MRGVFIQILMTRTLDSVTGSNLKRWLQRDNLLRSHVAQATMQTQAASCYLHRVAVFGWPVSQLYFHSKVLFTSTSAGEEIEARLLHGW